MKKYAILLTMLATTAVWAEDDDQPKEEKKHKKGKWFESYNDDDNDTVSKDLDPYTETRNDNAGDYIKRPFEAGTREGATVFDDLKAEHHDDEGFFTKIGHGIQDIGAGAVATVAGAGTTATGVVTHVGRPAGAVVTLGASEEHNKKKKHKKKSKKKSQKKSKKKKHAKNVRKKKRKTDE